MVRVPWHPALLAISFVIVNFAETGIHIAATGRALVFAVAAALIAQAICSAVLRDRHFGSTAATGLLAMVIFLIPVSTVVAAFLRLNLLVAGILLGLLAALTFIAIRRGPRLKREAVTRGLNTVTGVLALVVAVGLLTTPLAAQTMRDVGLGPESEPSSRPSRGATPDIFVILMDGHPRADAMLEQTGHDPSGFLNRLEDAGFSVSEQARSNYDWTGATLASLLGMRLLDEIPPGGPEAPGEPPAQFLELRSLINQNAAFELLRAEGYETVAIGPPYEHVALRSADRFIAADYLNTFECHLLRRTAIGDAAWALAPNLLGDAHRRGVVNSLREAEAIAAEHDDRSQFVLVHLPVPHPPVLWDQDGNPVEDSRGSDCAPPTADGLDDAALRAAYLDSLAYADDLVVESLEALVSPDGTDPVVVVISDHGARFKDPQSDRADRAWRNAFGILFAAYTPAHGELFPDDVSLVNLLPRLFNTYLGTELERQPNQSHWSDGSLAVEP